VQYEVIIPAAGSGRRMQAGQNKLLLDLQGKTIIERTVQVFCADSNCDKVILAIKPDEEVLMRQLFSPLGEKITFVYGGSERQRSVQEGLRSVSAGCKVVLVHDGARPFVQLSQISELVAIATQAGSAVLAVRVKDTIKRVQQSIIQETVDREQLWAMQTPQAFRTEILREAHEWAVRNNFWGTDEASLVEQLDYPIQIVEGSYHNIKITTVEDMLFAQAILSNF